MAKILVIEDGIEGAGFQALLEAGGHAVWWVKTATEGLELCSGDTEKFDLVLTDFQLPGMNGIDVIAQLHRTNPRMPIILMTAYHTTERVIESARLGAYDYILKPIEPTEFQDKVEKALESRQRKIDSGSASGGARDEGELVGKSRMMLEVYKQIGRLARITLPVLIRGESGSGKETVALAMHHKSKRADQPFVVMDCAAIPEGLQEDQLFGSEKHAPAGGQERRIGCIEQAHRGTLFLKQVIALRLTLQGELLRVLENKTIQCTSGLPPVPIDVRVIASTDQDIETAVQRRKISGELYNRLTEAVIVVPPLRERLGDIPDLLRHFLSRDGAALGTPNPSVTDEAYELLTRHTWPGNVREFRSVIRRALVLASGFAITGEDVLNALKLAPKLPSAEPIQKPLASAASSKSYIFVSHVEEDSAVALGLARGLEAAGFRTWYYERDSVPGVSYLVQTGRAIEQSSGVILLISTNSVNSPQVSREVVRAHESSKPFIPVLLDVSHLQFQNLQPEWREAIGAATSVRMGEGGAPEVLPRVIAGLEALGVRR